MAYKIDIQTWQRREIYDFFCHASHPFYMVTFRLDVTTLYNYVKKQQLSFYYALTYLCAQALDQVEAFHYTIRDQEIWYLPHRNPSFTDLHKDSELFHIVTMPSFSGTLEDFCQAAAKRSRQQQVFIDTTMETDALVYISCTPWFDMTAITNERDLQPEDSIPHITWGKYMEHGGRKELGMSVEVNHRLIDGIHIGQFYQQLERLIQALTI